MDLSREPEKIKLPSGVNSNVETVCSCPVNVLKQVSVSKFHILMLKSAEQEAKNFPLVSKLREFTVFE